MIPWYTYKPYQKVKDSRGYVWVWVPIDDPYFDGPRRKAKKTGGWPHREHRYVMSKMLGRRLKAKETVHHLDGNRSNNRIKNLELWQGNHGSGVRRVDLVIQWLNETPRAEVRRVLRGTRHATIVSKAPSRPNAGRSGSPRHPRPHRGF